MALQRLHDSILHQDPALDLTLPSGNLVPENNLPERLTSFVGRVWEIAEIEALLQADRLVTLVGVGGAGKSRLAVEAARRSLAHYPGGVWLVELASLTQPGLVINLVAATLRVREHPERPLIDVLAEHLGKRKSLLLLDNCEHLLDEVAELAQSLLWACPRLSVLATTRERLGITGESLKPLSGLAFSEPSVCGESELETTDAARLLVDRAGAVRPGFRLDDDNAGAVALICERLDGLPLAIELAAARVSALDVEQVAVRLSDRFRLLDRGDRTASPRHQTLRAVVEWSYGLLDDAERRVFNRVAVFVGGFTLEAAEAVCPQPGEGQQAVASGLWRLVDKSLVVSEGYRAARRRFRLLETLRAYGLERLFESDEAEQVRDRHAQHFSAVVAPAREGLRSPDQSEWLNRLELEHGNLREAMEWSVQRGAAETAVRLAGSLYPFWDLRGHYSEGRRWLARALAAEGPVAPATARSRAHGVGHARGDPGGPRTLDRCV